MNTTKLAVAALILIVITPIGIGYLMNVEETQKSSFEVVNKTNVTNTLLNSTSPYSLERVGSYMDNAFLAAYYADPSYKAGVTENYTQIPKAQYSYTGLSITSGSWQDVFTAAGWNANSITLRLTAENVSANENLGQLRITTLDGSTTTYNIKSPSSAESAYAFLYYKLGTLTFQDADAAAGFEIVSNVSKIEINTPYNSVKASRYDIFGDEYDRYYDYTQGWAKPSSSQTLAWANGMDNSLVEIISDVPGASTPGKMQPFDESNNSPGAISYWFSYTLGNYGAFVQIGSADPVKLGDYNVIRIVFELDHVTIYGLNAWPSMGMGFQSSYNSVQLDYAAAITSIHYINLIAGSNPYVRVDRSQSLAGSFPVITNATLNAANLYPGTTSYGVQLSHVDVSGSSILFGGVTLPVSNGYVTVGNKTTTLEGSTWQTIYEDGQYNNTVNGILVSSTPNPATMKFNGSWSTIVELQHMDTVTWTSTEWIPGEFAWDGMDANFCIVGLITCAAVFVGLGMYGARSGAKVGKLMIICGCAAFVFLALM